MTSKLSLASFNPDRSRPGGQMSHANRRDLPPEGGRGRGAAAARRAQRAPVVARVWVGRGEATAFWAGLVAARCASREECAVLFGVTFQTACNWFDGFSCPTGDKVMMAQRLWPEEFAAALPGFSGGGRG